MRRGLAGVIVLIAIAGAVSMFAQAPTAADGQYVVYGAGGISCGQWTSDLSSLGPNPNASGWVIGFVSGFGAAGQRLKPTDARGIEAFITNYCQAHPLDRLVVATKALVEALAE